MKTLPSLVAVLAFATPCFAAGPEAAGSKFTDWSAPTNVSSVNDAGPTYFENEGGRPQLYFQSQRPGGAGQADIYVSEQQEDGTWSAPQRVVELSTKFQEQRPTIRFDGLEMVIQSNRPPSLGFDLWVSTRASVTDEWSAPVR